MKKIFKMNLKNENKNWQNIVKQISNGFELQEIGETISDDDILKYNDSIVLAPDYQREYRSSLSDESSLIESALLDIPIPPIFLASDFYRQVQVLNVVDGQHRLRAFHRFINNAFALKDLSILVEFNGYFYKELPIEYKRDLLSRSIMAITFRDFPGKEFELEIFNRYNKGTKPLSPQEIRHAVYGSQVNDAINVFCSDLIKNPSSELAKAYAISKDRFLKKTCHENIFVILSILENGIDQSYKDEKGNDKKIFKSPQYAEVYMKRISQEETMDSYKRTMKLFKEFNCFVKALTKITEYPFSREIYGVSSQRGNKFQVSLSMILAGIMHKLSRADYNVDRLNDKETLEVFRKKIYVLLNSSFLEDPEYKASTTNPTEIIKVVEQFIVPV
jgi:hypothetical protein